MITSSSTLYTTLSQDGSSSSSTSNSTDTGSQGSSTPTSSIVLYTIIAVLALGGALTLVWAIRTFTKNDLGEGHGPWNRSLRRKRRLERYRDSVTSSSAAVLPSSPSSPTPDPSFDIDDPDAVGPAHDDEAGLGPAEVMAVRRSLLARGPSVRSSYAATANPADPWARFYALATQPSVGAYAPASIAAPALVAAGPASPPAATSPAATSPTPVAPDAATAAAHGPSANSLSFHTARSAAANSGSSGSFRSALAAPDTAGEPSAQSNLRAPSPTNNGARPLADASPVFSPSPSQFYTAPDIGQTVGAAPRGIDPVTPGGLTPNFATATGGPSTPSTLYYTAPRSDAPTTPGSAGDPARPADGLMSPPASVFYSLPTTARPDRPAAPESAPPPPITSPSGSAFHTAPRIDWPAGVAPPSKPEGGDGDELEDVILDYYDDDDDDDDDELFEDAAEPPATDDAAADAAARRRAARRARRVRVMSPDRDNDAPAPAAPPATRRNFLGQVAASLRSGSRRASAADGDDGNHRGGRGGGSRSRSRSRSRVRASPSPPPMRTSADADADAVETASPPPARERRASSGVFGAATAVWGRRGRPAVSQASTTSSSGSSTLVGVAEVVLPSNKAAVPVKAVANAVEPTTATTATATTTRVVAS
ncbi:hypothetical protein HK405_008792 [Cladochytrium tenue]|nr:hypothetical protein HK405_008792 [Cladochytrium tenue]